MSFEGKRPKYYFIQGQPPCCLESLPSCSNLSEWTAGGAKFRVDDGWARAYPLKLSQVVSCAICYFLAQWSRGATAFPVSELQCLPCHREAFCCQHFIFCSGGTCHHVDHGQHHNNRHNGQIGEARTHWPVIDHRQSRLLSICCCLEVLLQWELGCFRVLFRAHPSLFGSWASWSVVQVASNSAASSRLTRERHACVD